MGNEPSSITAPSQAPAPPTPPPSAGQNRSEHIAGLICFAQSSYEQNPTEALSALMQALTLNSGKASADRAMERIRFELGDDIADHVGDRNSRLERAMQVIREMLEDESTILYESNRQHLLQQAMEDGSSVVCTKCNGCVPAARWQQHQNFWCTAIEGDADIEMDE